MAALQAWGSAFTSVSSEELSPDQEQHLYQANERDLLGLLHGWLCCCTPCSQESAGPFSPSFQGDLLKGRAYWTGTFAVDYGFHVANEHPLLGCFLAHPAHPYNKLERLAVLIIVSCLTFPPTFAILRWSKHLQAKQAKELGTWGEVLAVEQLTRLGAQLEILLLVTIPSLVVQLILESLAILDFQMQEGTGLGKYSSCRPLCDCAVRCILCVKQGCLVLSLALAGLVYYISATSLGRKGHMTDALGPFLLSRAQSWTLWFFIDGLMPCCGFLARWCSEGPRGRRSTCNSARNYGTGGGYYTLHDKRKGLEGELCTALQDLARNREEAALLQWRIHHLEAELLELARIDPDNYQLAMTAVVTREEEPDAGGGSGSLPTPWGPAPWAPVPSAPAPWVRPQAMVGRASPPAGWR